MNLIELDRALKQLRLGGMAAVLEARLRQAQTEPLAPIDLLSCLVSDELALRGERLLERRKKQTQFRDSQKTLDNFDFAFNKKMNRSLVFDLSTGTFISRHEDALFLGPPGTGKSHLAQAIGQAAIQQGYRVLYRETHALLEELAEATLDGTRKEMGSVRRAPAHHRRSRHAQVAAHRRRRTAGNHHAPLRAGQTMLTSNRQWKTGANCWETGRRDRHARPYTAPRSRAQVRPAKLAHQNRLATTGGGRIEHSQSWTANPVGRF